MTASTNALTRMDRAIAGQVWAEIKSRGRSITDVAEQVRVRREYLSDRVNGHAPFTPDLLAAVARALGTTGSELTARAEFVVSQRAASAA